MLCSGPVSRHPLLLDDASHDIPNKQSVQQHSPRMSVPHVSRVGGYFVSVRILGIVQLLEVFKSAATIDVSSCQGGDVHLIVDDRSQRGGQRSQGTATKRTCGFPLLGLKQTLLVEVMSTLGDDDVLCSTHGHQTDRAVTVLRVRGLERFRSGSYSGARHRVPWELG